jgi:hypothetical protein
MRKCPAALTPPAPHTGFGIGHIRQNALAVLQKRAAFVGERDAPGGANQQLDAQTLLQTIQAAPHDGRGHAFGVGSGSQTAARSHGHEGFELLEFIHDLGL